MIKVKRKGLYCILGKENGEKYLILDKKLNYRWTCQAKQETLSLSGKKIDDKEVIITSGRYRLYDVRSESHLTNLYHFEILISKNIWQGYLLPDGLPTKDMKSKFIFPTNEVITYSITPIHTPNYDTNSFAKSAAL